MEIITGNFSLKQLIKDHWINFTKNTLLAIRYRIYTVISRVSNCGTGGLGYAILKCPCCGKIKHINYTCKSRFCFSCSKPASDLRLSKLLGRLPQQLPYYHIFFTIPQEFRKFFACNRKGLGTEAEVLNILSDAANETLLTFFAQNFKCVPGFVSVIHTFGAALNRNPHIHFMVTAGGFDMITKSKRISSQDKFMNYKHIMKIRRAVLTKHIRKYTRLHFTDQQYNLFNLIINECFKKDWCVFFSTKATNTTKILSYIGRYLKRPVIGMSRILGYDGVSVSFSHFDKTEKVEVISTVPAQEFLGLLVRHIPDYHLKVVRYGGIFANRTKKKFLSLINSISIIRIATLNTKDIPYIPKTYQSRLRLTFGINPYMCTCGGFFAITGFVLPHTFHNTS